MDGGPMSDGAALRGGFADPGPDAARAFRAAMEALARPGRTWRLAGALPPAPLSPAAGALLLALCDAATPVHLAGGHDVPAVRAWLAFHCGAPLAPPARAAFAVGRWDALLPLGRFAVGTPDYPDRSATLVVEVDGFEGPASRLAGPGIADEARLALPAGLAAARAALPPFPLGLDLFLAAGDRLAGLPRTARIG